MSSRLAHCALDYTPTGAAVRPVVQRAIVNQAAVGELYAPATVRRYQHIAAVPYAPGVTEALVAQCALLDKRGHRLVAYSSPGVEQFTVIQPDHPAWIAHVVAFAHNAGPLFLDDCAGAPWEFPADDPCWAEWANRVTLCIGQLCAAGVSVVFNGLDYSAAHDWGTFADGALAEDWILSPTRRAGGSDWLHQMQAVLDYQTAYPAQTIDLVGRRVRPTATDRVYAEASALLVARVTGPVRDSLAVMDNAHDGMPDAVVPLVERDLGGVPWDTEDTIDRYRRDGGVYVRDFPRWQVVVNPTDAAATFICTRVLAMRNAYDLRVGDFLTLPARTARILEVR